MINFCYRASTPLIVQHYSCYWCSLPFGVLVYWSFLVAAFGFFYVLYTIIFPYCIIRVRYSSNTLKKTNYIAVNIYLFRYSHMCVWPFLDQSHRWPVNAASVICHGRVENLIEKVYKYFQSSFASNGKLVIALLELKFFLASYAEVDRCFQCDKWLHIYTSGEFSRNFKTFWDVTNSLLVSVHKLKLFFFQFSFQHIIW